MAISWWWLFFAQKMISMGITHAVWIGIGAAGNFVMGIVLHGDPNSMMRIFGVLTFSFRSALNFFAAAGRKAGSR